MFILTFQGGPSSERAIESGLKVPSPVAHAMEAYAERYQALKAPRKLHWKPHVGCVEMQVRCVCDVHEHAKVEVRKKEEYKHVFRCSSAPST